MKLHNILLCSFIFPCSKMKAAMLCHSYVVVDDKQNIDVQFAKGSPTGQVQKRASQEQLKMSEMN